MVYIIIVRHGETDFNKNNLIQGEEVDPPLNNMGIKQAQITGKYLSTYFKFDKVYSSTLKRASETAKIISKENKYKDNIFKLNILKELKKGIFSGKDRKYTYNFIKNNKILNKLSNTLKYDNLKYNLKYKKYYNIEAKILKQESYEKINEIINKIINIIKKENKNLLIVTHGSLITSLISKLTNIINCVPKNIIPKKMANCHITIIEFKNDKFKFLKTRDNKHLYKFYKKN